MVLRMGSSNQYESTEYLTSPYIGFTSFYRSVDYPESVDILFIGDSMTERGDMQYFFPDLNIVCQGIGGDTTEGVLNRIDCAEKCNPQIIVINIGINDIMQNISLEASLKNLSKTIESLHQKLPDTRILSNQFIR